jgi:hypothetical protein
MARTFLLSAKDDGATPYHCLHNVHNRIIAHPDNRIHELLPAAWMQARATPARPLTSSQGVYASCCD